MDISTRTLGATLLWCLTTVATGVVAQSTPPAPVSEMIGQFEANPHDLGYLAQAVEVCPIDPQSWRFEFLEGLMELPPSPEADGSLASALAWQVEHCDEDVFASEWARELFSRPTVRWYRIARLGAALGRSSLAENRQAALQSLFDPRIDNQIRNTLASEWVGDSDYLHRDLVLLFSEAYDTSDGVPPSQLTLSVGMIREMEGPARARIALRALLDAVVRRPDVPAALTVVNTLLSNAVNLDPQDPWMLELGEVMQDLVDGGTAPPDLVEFIEDRLGRFCRGDAAAIDRNPRCPSL